MQFWNIVVIYYVVLNICAFATYGFDKARAKAHGQRVPERTLIGMAMFGGGVGAILGMRLFHHKTLKTKFRVWVPVALILHAVLIVAITVQNNHIVVTNYEYDAPDVNCRIVQVSDLHNATLCWDRGRLAERIEECEPDYIVLTGDILDSIHMDMDAAIETVASITSIADTYFVTGNHEWRINDTERNLFISRLEEVGVTVLVDEYVILTDNNGSKFALIGLDDSSLGTDVLSDIMANVPEDMFTVLLAHEPQYMKSFADNGVDVVLSGHYHGGQFIIPGVGPVVSPEFEFFPDYAYGQIVVDDTTIITSRGIGNSIIPVRINNFPELVVLDIN